MTSTATRSFPAIVAAMLFAITALFAANAAHAQCTAVKVQNNLNCDVQLCLFDNAVDVTVCADVPAGGGVVINIPAGFTINGGVSAGGNRYAFGVKGCTPCYAQITPIPVLCCGQVCYDPANCHITINQCTLAFCNP